MPTVFKKQTFNFIRLGDKDKLHRKVKTLYPGIDRLPEFERAVTLMKAVQEFYHHENRPAKSYDFLKDTTSDILDSLEQGDSGQCGAYATVFVGLAKAFDLVARPLSSYWYSESIPGIVPFQHINSYPQQKCRGSPSPSTFSTQRPQSSG